jgi:hypothetical protein
MAKMPQLVDSPDDSKAIEIGENLPYLLFLPSITSYKEG